MLVIGTFDLFKKQLSKKTYQLTPEEIQMIQHISFEILTDIVSLCEKNNIPYMLGGGTALGAVRHRGFIPWDDDVDINVPRRYIDRLMSLLETEYSEKYELEVPLRTEGYLQSFIQVRRTGTIFREYLIQDRDHCGIKVDIFPIENTYDNPVKRILHGVGCDFGLLLLSCYRMFICRKEFRELAKDVPSIAVRVWVKSLVGAVIAPFHKLLYTGVQNMLACCKDDTSKFVVIPSGSRHFFGELYHRKPYLETINAEFNGRVMKISKDYDKYLTNLYGNYMIIPHEEERAGHVLYELQF